VRHQLSEYSLADIHPSLSVNAIPVSAAAVWGGILPGKVQIEKSKIAPNSLIPWMLSAEGKF
jgi:hypothetical protein